MPVELVEHRNFICVVAACNLCSGDSDYPTLIYNCDRVVSARQGSGYLTWWQSFWNERKQLQFDDAQVFATSRHGLALLSGCDLLWVRDCS